MNTRSEIKKQKINTILDYGIEAFREKGYHFAGVQELASACSISKGSFYQYFDSKENFARLVIQHYSQKINQTLEQLLNSAEGSGHQKLTILFCTMIDHIKENKYQAGCLYGDLGAELGGVNDTCSTTLSHCMESTTAIVEKAVSCGQQDGSIRDDLQSSELTSVLMNSWGGTILKMKIDRNNHAGELFLSHFVNNFLTP